MGGNSSTRPGTKVRTRITRGTLALMLVGALAACDSGTEPELSMVKIQLTDAPTDVIASAEVWISHVYLQGGGGAEPESVEGETSDSEVGRVDLFNDPENPLHMDLLALQDGVTADLTDAIVVNAGRYQGLRLVVDSARVTLIEGVTFEDGTGTATLFVPSGSQSGIKVKLDHILDAQAGETTTVLVDFDVAASFVVQQSQATGLIRSVMLKPVLKEVNRETVDG